MRKTILTILASTLIAASAVQIAAAAERHSHKTATVSASEKFKNANNSIPQPAEPDVYSSYYSHGMSAPAGR